MILSFVRSIAYFSIPLLFVKSISYYSPTARYYLRLTSYISTLLATSVYGVVLSLVLSPTGRRYYVHYYTARAFYFLGNMMMGITCEVEGEHWFEATGPAVMVGNHQSMLDILYLGRIFPERAAMVAKKELKWIPLFGQYLAFSGTVFLDRSSNTNAVKSLAEAGETIRSRKISVWLFPEGTRSLKPENTLLPFKKGAFHLAVEAGVPIIPVVCENYWKLYRPGLLSTGKMKVKVLEPIPTKDLTIADVSSLTLRTHEIMEAALRELSCDKPISPPEEKAAPVLPTEDEDQKTFLDETTQSVDSTSPERCNSEGSVVETESDEGMVVISKPTSS